MTHESCSSSGLHTGSHTRRLGRVCPTATFPGAGRGTVHLRRFTTRIFELPSCQSRSKGGEWTVCCLFEKNIVWKAKSGKYRKGPGVLNWSYTLSRDTCGRMAWHHLSSLSITRRFAWHQNKSGIIFVFNFGILAPLAGEGEFNPYFNSNNFAYCPRFIFYVYLKRIIIHSLISLWTKYWNFCGWINFLVNFSGNKILPFHIEMLI